MSIARQVAPELPRSPICASHHGLADRRGRAVSSRRWRPFSVDPNAFPSELPPRQGLYKVFLQLWKSTVHERPPSRFNLEPKNAAERDLDAITPLPRQVFLLRAVEGFSVAEIADILDMPPEAVVEANAQAGREIAEQVATDILIIEDEPIIALDIEALVRELGHGVTGIARTHKEALASVAGSISGLVLADIHLADGSSGLGCNEILTRSACR